MFQKILYALCAAGAVVVGSYLAWRFWPTEVPADAGDAVSASQQTLDTVELTPEKLALAGIELDVVSKVSMHRTRTVAGRLDYDQDRHVAIKSACDGILVDVLVRPGDRVVAGQVVAVISSSEVGAARSLVRSRLAELSLVSTQQQWQQDICGGVEELVDMIRAQQSPEVIEQALQDDSLGDYREKLVSAYTRELQARRVVDNSRDAASQGAIPVSVQQQRETQVQTAAAALEGTIEQSLFEVQQQCRTASAKLAEAQRMLDISIQELNTLLGPAAQKVTAEQFVETQDETLSNVSLISPLDGTVEERMFSASERVRAGESVFTVADCSSLWAVADVRERDWAAISVDIGQEVEIASPAIPDSQFTGTVYIVGRRFDPATGAAPLIAKMDVSDTRLRPGLFIRMRVPTAPPREVVAVPQSAVVVHEDRHFVFVVEDELHFRRVDVEIGESDDNFIEIKSGVAVGQRIAVSGVFKLKSELLLAGEEE